jgi:hypothetical protein
MSNLGPMFNYKEENLMDRMDQRRKDSGIKLHYGQTILGKIYKPDRFLHNLYATNGDRNNVVGHVEWHPETGIIEGITVHPDWQKSTVAPTLLKAANDLQIKTSEKSTGIRGSEVTTNSGYSLMKKLAPTHKTVLDPNKRVSLNGGPFLDDEDNYDNDDVVKERLNELSDLNYNCWDCKGQDANCPKCGGDGYETEKSTPIEKVLKWE